MKVQCPNCGETISVNGLGRKPFSVPVTEVDDALRFHRSVAARWSLIDNSGSKVRRDKRECKWAQRIVNRWAKGMLMPTVPIVAFVDTEEEAQHDGIAGYGEGCISLKLSEWNCRDNFWKLFILGHEFIHWLQDIRSSDTKESAAEREAYKLGLELARRQIAQWRRRPKLPLQLELPLEGR